MKFTEYSTTVVLSDDYKKVLLIKNNRGHFAGKWNMIGGHMEDGEFPFNTARRELKEETDIDAFYLQWIMSGKFYDYSHLHVYYTIIKQDQEIVATEEGDLLWFDINKVLNGQVNTANLLVQYCVSTALNMLK